MRKTIIRMICAIATACLVLSACTSSQEKNDASGTEQATASAAKSLVITYLKIPVTSYAVKIFKERHGDIQINENTLGETVLVSTETRGDTQIAQSNFVVSEESENKLLTGIMAGNGPDIIVADTHVLGNIEKSMDSGAFADLSPYFEKASDINMDEYQKAVMNWGVRDGKRYVVPICYDIPTLYSYKETMEKNNVQFDRNHWTWETLTNEMTKFYNTYGDDKLFFSYPLSINEIMRSSGVELVDYEKREAYFDSPSFIKILEYAKSIYPCVMENTQKYNMVQNYKNPWDMLTDGTLVAFDDRAALSPIGLANLQDAIQGKPPEIYTFPTLDGSSGLTAQPVIMAAITDKCQNKEVAFEFIKFLLSPAVQKYTYVSGFPVHLPSFRERLQEEQDKDWNISDSTFSLSEAAVQNVTGCMGDDTALYDIVNKFFNQYLDNKITAEECARQIQDMVEIYLAE